MCFNREKNGSPLSRKNSFPIMSQIGKLSKIGIEKILKWAEKGEKTGAFVFSRGEEKKYVYFKNGQILTASSNNPKERLGQVMLRKKMISPKEIEKIQEFQRKEKVKFGKAVLLLKMGTQKDLLDALHKQTDEILINLFDWVEGEFLFYLNKVPPVEISNPEHNLDELLRLGLERKTKWKELRRKLPHHEIVLEVSFDVNMGDSEQQFSEEEFKVMTLVDGISSINEICQLSDLTEFDTVRALVKLLDHNLIKLSDSMQDIDVDPHDEGSTESVDLDLDSVQEKQSPLIKTKELEILKKELDSLLGDGDFLKARELIRSFENSSGPFTKDSELMHTFRLELLALDNIPSLKNGSGDDIIKNLTVDPKAGFIISRIDGKLNIKLLSNISGFPKDNVQEILYNLFMMDVISIERGQSQEELLQQKAEQKQKAEEQSEKPNTEEIIKRIAKQYQNIPKMDYYEILGIDKKAEAADIKKAYHTQAKSYHPDMLRDIDTDTLKMSEVIFDKVQLAYDTLSDEEGKKNYDKAKGFNLSQEEQRKMAKIKAKAGLQYQIGMKAYKVRNYKKAIEFIRSAIDINPTEAVYYGVLAEIQAKNPKWFNQAKENCTRAISLDPHNAYLFIVMGGIYLDEGLVDDAEAQFRKALVIDPTNEEAKQALEKMGKKVEKPPINPFDKIITKDIATL